MKHYRMDSLDGKVFKPTCRVAESKSNNGTGG